ncbi:MAG: hypothetical protein ACKVOJ_00735 [Sphingomonadaceae bacterium]
MTESYELHFCDGFADDDVSILIDGKAYRSLTLTTKMQIGLAHIEPLVLKSGQMVTIEIAKDHIRTELRLKKDRPFIKVNKYEDAVATESTDVSPGYL